MEQLTMICLIGACILTPVLMAMFTGAVYFLGIGAVQVPGIARREAKPGKDWATLPELTRKSAETISAGISVVGALFGLTGFLLPWVKLDIGAAGRVFDLGGLTGTLNGIALLFQSILAGSGLLGVEVEGAPVLGAILLAIGVFVSLIPLGLLVCVLLGLGMISVPMGLLKTSVPRLSRPLLFLSALALCLTCTFFAGIQGTVGGIKVGGSEGLFGTSFSIGVELANGFWITVGGLILALVGAVSAYSLSRRFGEWAERLSGLEQELESEA